MPRDFCALLLLLLVGIAKAQSPANDKIAHRGKLEGQSTSDNGTNVNASPEVGEPFAGWGCKAELWSSTVPSSGTAMNWTFNCNLDTAVGVYTGASVAVLPKLAHHDEDMMFLQRLLEGSVTRNVANQIRALLDHGEIISRES